MQGDQRVRCTATITTTTSTTNRSFFLMAKWVDSNNYLYAELRTASATGVTTLWLIVRTGGVSRTIGSSANALVANQTTQTFDLEVRVTGLTAGAYMNGSATPTVSGAITDPEAAALTAATSAAFSATNQTGATVASFDLYVTGNVAATRVRAYNGSLGGTTWAQYQLPRMTRLLPEAPDVVFLSSSHNYGAMTPAAYLVEVEDTIAAVQGLWPDAGIVLVAQNPRYSPAPYRTEHARRLAALRRFARVRGCGYLPAFERFLASAADEGRSKIQADGIHPVTGSSGDTGSAFWATVANDYFRELSNVV